MARTTVRRLVAAVALAAAITGCSEDRADGEDDATTTSSVPVEDCRADLVACARASTIGPAVGDDVGEAGGEPIVLGLINQDRTPVASFPELSSAAQAAAAFVNAELGGIGGRPIRLEVCNTEFSPEGSTACAQDFVEAGVPAVLGGIDVFGSALATLEDNGIPYVGGVPASTPSVTSPVSFQFSGGVYGPMVAFADHAAREVGAATVAIVYPEYDNATAAAAAGEAVLVAAGVDEVQLVPYPVTATDLTSPLQAAAGSDPDALLMLAADTGCEGALEGIGTVGITAQVYLVGSCASPTILDRVGEERTEGTIFNVEGPIDPDDPDRRLYFAVAEDYGDGFDPVGAGTVSFRAFMNLYVVLAELGPDATAADVLAAFRGARDVPSFLGHPYTCDGAQLPDQPAMCSPHQILAQREDGQLVQITDWIDVGAVAAAAG